MKDHEYRIMMQLTSGNWTVISEPMSSLSWAEEALEELSDAYPGRKLKIQKREITTWEEL